MTALPGYDDWKCAPPDEVDAVVRCTTCGETADFDDAARSGWDITNDDMDEDQECRGICPVCREENDDDE